MKTPKTFIIHALKTEHENMYYFTMKTVLNIEIHEE